VSHPAGRLPAAPLLSAIDARATEAGAGIEQFLTDRWALRRYARARRGIDREGIAHRVGYLDAQRLARHSSMTLGEIYPASHLDAADRRSREGLEPAPAAYRFSLSAPPSYTAAWALVPRAVAEALEHAWADAAASCLHESAAWADLDLCGPVRPPSCHGLTGWVGIRSQSPGARFPALLEAVITLIAVRGDAGGGWRALTARGDALVRTATLIEAAARARLREISQSRFGTCWRLDPYTGLFEIPFITPAMRRDLTDPPTRGRAYAGGPGAHAPGRDRGGAHRPDPDAVSEAVLPRLVEAVPEAPVVCENAASVKTRAMARLEMERPRRGRIRPAMVMTAALDAAAGVAALASARALAERLAPEVNYKDPGSARAAGP
jgi:hypothetical protein